VQADVVMRGRRREDDAEASGVVEVSWAIEFFDVQRAARRAALRARTGMPALAIVAGYWLAPEADEPARAFKVWQVMNGRVTPPAPADFS
jgi:hypothetical protein